MIFTESSLGLCDQSRLIYEIHNPEHRNRDGDQLQGDKDGDGAQQRLQ